MRRREAELQTKLAESAAWRAKEDANNQSKIEEAWRKAEMIRKRQECATFTTPGYWLLGSPLRSDQKQPISLSALQGAGALISGPDGLKVLFKIGQDRSDTLRPRWGFRAYNGNFTLTVRNPQSYEQLKLAQQYLIEYGAALVAGKRSTNRTFAPLI